MANHIFRRFAGSFPLRLHTFDDLLHMAEVPEAHWVATACPVQGLSCDPRFLSCVDQDNNGRIRAEELREAIRWTGAMLADHGGCVPGGDTLELARLAPAAAALHDAVADGLPRLIESALKKSRRDGESPTAETGRKGLRRSNLSDTFLRIFQSIKEG